MGNKIGRRKQVVNEKYTRPQGLYQHLDIDHKKLRKLILDAKLAPCYPGDDDGCTVDFEECPICFLYYPSLNRSKCCTKGLCTECFLQMKPTYPTRSAQCPFCKTSNYAVEYRGAKTKEEKSVEQVEEQRVMEAQIRMKQQELHDEKERLQFNEGRSYSPRSMPSSGAEYKALCFRCSTQDDGAVSSEDLCSVSVCPGPSHLRQTREYNSDLELEELMVMEAIWYSIQDQDVQRDPSDERILNLPEFNCNASVQTNAEHQLFNMGSTIVPGNIEPVSVNFSSEEDRITRLLPAVSSIEVLPESRSLTGEQDELMTVYNESVEEEVETSHTSLSITIDSDSTAKSGR